jgi:hypothetical protein
MLYIPFLLRPLLGMMLLTSACSPAETDRPEGEQPSIVAQTPKGKKGKKGGHKKNKKADLPAGLRQVGTLTDGILESSGLCAAPETSTYFTFGDDGQQPFVYRVDGTGQQVGQFTLGAPNHDWESLSRDNSGNYYMGDCGNNNNDRRNLAILRFPKRSPKSISNTPTKPRFRPVKASVTSTARPASGTLAKCTCSPKTAPSQPLVRCTPCPKRPALTRLS